MTMRSREVLSNGHGAGAGVAQRCIPWAMRDSQPTVPGRRGALRHDEAVIQAEVRRLALALAPFGVLGREALAREVGAERWREGTFEQAVSVAVKTGVIQKLPGGFYGRRPMAG